LGDLPVGVLSVRGGQWTFRYADEFRAQQKLRPLPIFPDVNKVYESNELWSFFRMRVPSLKQPSVRRIVDEQNIDSKDEVKLLKRFGRRTISNPFELVPESVPSETITTGWRRIPETRRKVDSSREGTLEGLSLGSYRRARTRNVILTAAGALNDFSRLRDSEAIGNGALAKPVPPTPVL
jgi:HipA-like protein